MKPAWTILGAGAMGCLSAAQLAAAGYNSCLRVRAKRLADWPGYLELTTPQGQQQTLSTECMATSNTHPIQALLITTKATDTRTALEQVRSQLVAHAPVVVLQNGMGSQQAVAQALPEHPVYAASTTNGGFCDRPFKLTWAGRGQTLIGPLNHAAAAQPCPLTDLEGWQACPDINTILWRKLAINCVINPLTAVHLCRNGELLNKPAYTTELSSLCTEVEMLAAACDIKLFEQPLFDQACAVIRQTANNYSSMCQDIRQGRATEIDFINGYLCRLATDKGLTLTLNQQLLRQIKALHTVY